MNTFGWSGWDIVERATRYNVREPDEQTCGPIPLDNHVVSTALLIEMQRPPWYQEIDARKKAERQDAA